MFTKPVTKRCARLLVTHQHAILGISPFHSYFSRKRLSHLIEWASASFNSFHLFVPDGPLIHTLLACGYEPGKARKKAKRQLKYLFNKIDYALIENGFEQSNFDDLVLCSRTLQDNSSYQELLQKVLHRYKHDRQFRQKCLQTSAWVLAGQTHNPSNTKPDNADEIAVQYFLAELPLFMNGAAIAEAETSVFCYPQCPDFLRYLYHHERGKLISKGQGFVEITPKNIKW